MSKKTELIPIFKEFKWINCYQDFDENNFYFAFTLPHEDISTGKIVPKVMVATKRGLLAPERVMKDFGIQFKTVKVFDVEQQPIDFAFLEKFNEICDTVNEEIERKDILAIDTADEEILKHFGLLSQDSNTVEKVCRVELFFNRFFLFHALNTTLPAFFLLLESNPNIFSNVLDDVKRLKDIVDKCRVPLNNNISSKKSTGNYLYSTYYLYTLYKEFPKVLRKILSSIIDYYIDYEEEREAVDLVAVWALGTYVYTLFDHYPYLNFWGTKSSGKTKNLEVLQCLVFNQIAGTSFSGPASFRLVETYRPTILIDETHQITRNPEFRDFLIAGFNKIGKAWRTIEAGEKRFKPKSFDYYCPKAMAGITELQDILLDRAIKITMTTTMSEKRKRKPDMRNGFWKAVRTLCYIFAWSYYDEIRKAYSESDVDFDDPRESDLWKPMIVLGRMVGVDLKQYAIEKIKEKKEEEEESRIDLLVWKIIALNFEGNEQWISLRDVSEEITQRYKIDISSRSIGAILRKQKIRERKISGGYVKYKITREALEHILKREGLSIEKVKEQFASEIFVKFENPEFGKCSYCGEDKELWWKDSKGNYLCQDCYVEESKVK
jgi:hypothetical protein